MICHVFVFQVLICMLMFVLYCEFKQKCYLQIPKDEELKKKWAGQIQWDNKKHSHGA